MKMTKMGWQTLALVAVLGLIMTPAMAQPPGPPPGGPGGPGFGRGPGGPPHAPPHGGPGGIGRLLQMEEVRAELGIDEDQIEQLKALRDELREKFGKQMRDRRGRRGGPAAGSGNKGSGKKGKGKRGPEARGQRGPGAGGPGAGGPPDREAHREKMRARMEEVRTEVEGRLAEVLSPEQMERLKEIEVQLHLQRGGPRALIGGPVGDALALTEEQLENLRERAEEVREETIAKIQAIRQESHAQLLDVLTSEQREMLNAMRGEDFDLPAGPMMGRRGGRPGGPNCGPGDCRKGGPPRGRGGPGGFGPPPPRGEE